MSTATAEREVIETTAVTTVGKIDYGLIASELQAKVNADLAITINGVDDKAGYKLADTRRKEWVKVRTGIDRTRKDLNAEAKKHIDKVNSIAKELTDIAGQAEAHVTKLVDEIDTAIEKSKQDKLDAEFKARNDRLVAAGIILPRAFVECLSDMDITDKIAEKEELDRFRALEAEKAAQAKAEAERVAAELAEKNRIEAERLAAERAAFEKQQALAKAEADRLKAISDAETARLRAEADQLVAAERARLEAERIAREAESERLKKIDDERLALERAELEHQRLALAAAQKKIDDEREAAEQKERQRLAEIERQRIEAEEKESQRLAEEQRAASEAADKLRAEALRPDKEKLLSVAAAIHSIIIPQVSDELADSVRAINHIIVRSVSEITEVVHAI